MDRHLSDTQRSFPTWPGLLPLRYLSFRSTMTLVGVYVFLGAVLIAVGFAGVDIDWGVLAFITMSFLITGVVVFSSYPAFKTRRRDLVQTLKSSLGQHDVVHYVGLATASILVWQIIWGLIGVLPPVSGHIWAIANDPMTTAYHPLLRVLLLFELTARTALLYAGVLIGIDFVRRSHYVPKLVVGFLLSYLIILVTEQLLLREVIKPLQMFVMPPWQPFLTRELVMTIIACLIWVPYFMVSKRVKAMFKIDASATNRSHQRSLAEDPK